MVGEDQLEEDELSIYIAPDGPRISIPNKGSNAYPAHAACDMGCVHKIKVACSCCTKSAGRKNHPKFSGKAYP